MDKTTLADLIYDRLAGNTDNPIFEPEMAEEMELVYNADTHEAEYIGIKIDNREYALFIREVKGE